MPKHNPLCESNVNPCHGGGFQRLGLRHDVVAAVALDDRRMVDGQRSLQNFEQHLLRHRMAGLQRDLPLDARIDEIVVAHNIAADLLGRLRHRRADQVQRIAVLGRFGGDMRDRCVGRVDELAAARRPLVF
jgi:hypothetical protein